MSIRVEVNEARNLPSADRYTNGSAREPSSCQMLTVCVCESNGLSDPFYWLLFNNSQMKESSVVYKSLNPKWMDEGAVD